MHASAMFFIPGQKCHGVLWLCLSNGLNLLGIEVHGRRSVIIEGNS